MKLFMLFLVMSIFPLKVQAKEKKPIIPLNSKKWKLVWSDEFNGQEIDKSKWTHVDKGDGFGNNELQYYSPRKENSFIENGKLVIKAIKGPFKNRQYSSAQLESRGKGDFMYGKFSFRAKMPIGKGLWPAIWMLPTDMKKLGGWPMCGEIDIMEYLGHEPNKVFGTIHYGDSWPNNKHSGRDYILPNGTFHDKFHTFDLIWVPGMLQWFVDGKLYSTKTKWFTAAKRAKHPAPFNQDFFFILGVAVGGRLPGSPNASTKFPQQMEIDWARVYKYDGEFPEVQSPFAKAVVKIAPGFKLKGNDDNKGGGQPLDYFNERVCLKTYPLTKEQPTVLYQELAIPKAKKTSLTFAVSHQQGREWELRVKVDDKVIDKQLISNKTAKDGWIEKNISLSKYAGKKIKLELESRPKNSKNGFAYWDKIKIISK